MEAASNPSSKPPKASGRALFKIPETVGCSGGTAATDRCTAPGTLSSKHEVVQLLVHGARSACAGATISVARSLARCSLGVALAAVAAS